MDNISSPNSLEQMLREAKSLGKLDSEGSFTIAGEAAIGKLASFQLPRSSAWILKVIQSAVSSHAEGLWISQNNETTTFTYKLPPDFEVEMLKAALLSPEAPSDPKVAHLAIGLRTVGFGDRRAFTLACDQGEVRTILGWDGHQLVQKAEPIESGGPSLLRLGVAFPPEDQGRRLMGLAKSKGRATSEYLEVVKNAEVCPIPLFFDGLRVDRMQAPPADEAEGDSAILSVGWSTPPSAPPLPEFLLPAGMQVDSRSWRPTDKFTDDRIFHLDGSTQTRNASCMTKIRYNYKIDHHRSKNRSFQFRSIRRFSYYCWMMDGVIIDRQRVARENTVISYEIYLSAEGLSTDISGFTVRGTKAAVERMQVGRTHLRSCIESTLVAVQEHIPKPFGFHAVSMGALGAFLAVLVPVTAGKTFFAAFALLNLGLSAYDKSKIMDDCKRHLSLLSERLDKEARFQKS